MSGKTAIFLIVLVLCGSFGYYMGKDIKPIPQPWASLAPLHLPTDGVSEAREARICIFILPTFLGGLIAYGVLWGKKLEPKPITSGSGRSLLATAAILTGHPFIGLWLYSIFRE